MEDLFGRSEICLDGLKSILSVAALFKRRLREEIEELCFSGVPVPDHGKSATTGRCENRFANTSHGQGGYGGINGTSAFAQHLCAGFRCEIVTGGNRARL
jgi:hypothetical protein